MGNPLFRARKQENSPINCNEMVSFVFPPQNLLPTAEKIIPITQANKIFPSYLFSSAQARKWFAETLQAVSFSLFIQLEECSELYGTRIKRPSKWKVKTFLDGDALLAARKATLKTLSIISFMFLPRHLLTGNEDGGRNVKRIIHHLQTYYFNSVDDGR